MVCPHWLSFILYNPVRKVCTDRQAVLRDAGVTPDSVVLEIGAGNGFFTEVLAGHARFVYAVDVQDGMVRKLERRLRGREDRVAIIRDDVATADIREGLADVGFLYYTFHEVGDREQAAARIAAAVKAGGVVALFEPTVEVGKGAMERTVALFVAQGMEVEARRDGLFTRFVRLRNRGRCKCGNACGEDRKETGAEAVA